MIWRGFCSLSSVSSDLTPPSDRADVAAAWHAGAKYPLRQTYSVASVEVCTTFFLPKQNQWHTSMHTEPPHNPVFQLPLLQDLRHKEGTLDHLSQEMNCQKAPSGHILTPGLHFKCLEASARRFPRMDPDDRSVNRPAFVLCNLQPKPCSAAGSASCLSSATSERISKRLASVGA